MKILFDHQTFDLQNFGGISRYFYELIAEFNEDRAIEWELPIRYSNNLYLKNFSFFNGKIFPKVDQPDGFKDFCWGKQFKGKERLYKIKNKMFPVEPSVDYSEQNKRFSIQKLKEGDFDVFHPTYYDDYFLDHIGGKPFVLTVYDLIHEIFPEFFLHDAFDKSKNLLDKASKIIAISESTKSDLVNIFGIDENKVTVTYLANSLDRDTANVNADLRQRLPVKYILFNGNREGYKNFLFFCQVFAAVAQKESDLCIVCTGPAFTSNEMYLFNKLGITARMHHAYITDVELAYLYKNALAFIFPSMYEGFGLPVLEAFSCGCPVLVSHSSSLIEIGGDAVIYFEPKNAMSIIAALNTILYDEARRETLIDKGYEQVKKFSWKKTATETKNVYEQVFLHKTFTPAFEPESKYV